MRSLFLLFVFLHPFFAFAQPKGFQPVKNPDAFQKSLAQNNASVHTISSDFSQTKNLSLLSEKIKSKGKFFYKKADKVRIEYTTPYYYLLIMNGGQITVKDEQKVSKINTRNSKTMQSVNRIMMDCMRGTVLENPDFKTSVYENDRNYLLSLQPENRAMRNMFQSIEVYLNKKNYDLDRLTMIERGGDFTSMDFSNTRHNIALNDALFKAQ